MKRIPFRAATTAALTAVILLAACGSDAPAAGDTPLVTDAVTTQLTAPPEASTTSTLPPVSRIVSLSPTATEMVYAIGAGGQVLAVDDQSNYPPEALQKPHDLSGYQPNV